MANMVRGGESDAQQPSGAPPIRSFAKLTGIMGTIRNMMHDTTSDVDDQNTQVNRIEQKVREQEKETYSTRVSLTNDRINVLLNNGTSPKKSSLLFLKRKPSCDLSEVDQLIYPHYREMQKIIAMQKADGSFKAEKKLGDLMKLDWKDVNTVSSRYRIDLKIWMTALAVQHLAMFMKDEKEFWTLVSDRGKNWIAAATPDSKIILEHAEEFLTENETKNKV